jgi:hypothetical protein
MQVKILIYNAITGDSAIAGIIGTRLLWHLNPNIATYPLMTYQIIDSVAGYSFQPTVASSEQVDFQIDIYVDHKDMSKLSTLTDRIRAVLVPLNFQSIGGQAEGVDEGTNKVIRSMRWRYLNV